MSGRRVTKASPLPGIQRVAWSINEFASALGVNRNTIARAVASKEIHAVKLGGEWRIPDAELQRLLSGEAQGGAA